MYRLCLSLILLGALFAIPSAEGQDSPSLLTCISGAKASRDYEFRTQKWSGQKGHTLHPTELFEISTRSEEQNDRIVQPLRDKVFSGLNSKKPIVRSISRYIDGVEQGEEFQATMVSRAFDTVFLTWTNDPPHNKMWLAAVNTKHRRAIVTQVYEGITSVGGEMETLDCR